MKCDDVDRALSEDPRLPLEAQEHVKSCNRCQQLVSALNMSAGLIYLLQGLCDISQRVSAQICARCTQWLRRATFSQLS